ncbi:MAG: DUF6159 family protein [Euryarchaeota archaeon]
MGRLSQSINLIKATFSVLRKDKQLVFFPLISGFAFILVLIAFIEPWVFLIGTKGIYNPYAIYPANFLFYLISYAVVIFFNTGLITCAHIRLTGGDPTIRDGWKNAVRHIRPIIAWALISATVGLILQIIADQAGVVGEVIRGIVGGLWSLVTFFVVPVLVFEEKGVADAIKESWGLFKRTWGENVIGQISLVLPFVAIGALVIVAAVGVAFVGNPVLTVAALVVAIILIAALGIVYAALHGIFVATLYVYAQSGQVPAGFQPGLVEGAFAPKKPKKGVIGGQI